MTINSTSDTEVNAIDSNVHVNRHAKAELEINGSHMNGNSSTPPSKPSMGPDQPLPPVSVLDMAAAESEDQLLQDIIASMRLSGGCVIRNMVRQDALDELERDIRPHLKAAGPWNGKKSQ